MNKRIETFQKYTEHHIVHWQDGSTLYCVNTRCRDCIISKKYNRACTDMLHENDLIYIKEHYPEHFI